MLRRLINRLRYWILGPAKGGVTKKPVLAIIGKDDRDLIIPLAQLPPVTISVSISKTLDELVSEAIRNAEHRGRS